MERPPVRLACHNFNYRFEAARPKWTVLRSKAGRWVFLFPLSATRHRENPMSWIEDLVEGHGHRAAPRRAAHRLVDLANIVIDTHLPPGDATWPPENPVTAPVSSLA